MQHQEQISRQHDGAVGSVSNFPMLGASQTQPGREEPARTLFARDQAIVWPKVFEPALLTKLTALIARATYRSQEIPGVGRREVEQGGLASTAILVALRRRELWTWLESVTGCPPIGAVEGQIAQTRVRAGDWLDWHDDMVGDRKRLLGITIGLGDGAYSGGDFHLRRVGDKADLLRFRHDVPGQGLVFAVSGDLQHRLDPLSGGGPRRIFAGWFMA
jgi:hypothetical protein